MLVEEKNAVSIKVDQTRVYKTTTITNGLADSGGYLNTTFDQQVPLKGVIIKNDGNTSEIVLFMKLQPPISLKIENKDYKLL